MTTSNSFGGASTRIIPGEILPDPSPVEISTGSCIQVRILNTGDRPIQVGSHFHLYEANSSLEMDRSLAYGRRLAIPAGTAVRFEPGIARIVEVTELSGRRVVYGLRGLINGPLDGEPTNHNSPNFDGTGPQL